MVFGLVRITIEGDVKARLGVVCLVCLLVVSPVAAASVTSASGDVAEIAPGSSYDTATDGIDHSMAAGNVSSSTAPVSTVTSNTRERSRSIVVENNEKYQYASNNLFTPGYWRDMSEADAKRAAEVFIPDYSDAAMKLLEKIAGTGGGGALIDGIQVSVQLLLAYHHSNIADILAESGTTATFQSKLDQIAENGEKIESRQDVTGDGSFTEADRRQLYQTRKQLLEDAYSLLATDLDGDLYAARTSASLPGKYGYQAYGALREEEERIRSLLMVDYHATTSWLANRPSNATLAEATGRHVPNRDLPETFTAGVRTDVSTLETEHDYDLYEIRITDEHAGSNRRLFAKLTHPDADYDYDDDLSAYVKKGSPPSVESPASDLYRPDQVGEETKEFRIDDEQGLETGETFYLLVKAENTTSYKLQTGTRTTWSLGQPIPADHVDQRGYGGYAAPRLVSVDTNTSTITASESVRVTVTVENTGQRADWQGMSVAFPTVEDGADIEIVSDDIAGADPSVITGGTVGARYGFTSRSVQYPLVEVGKDDWASGETHTFTLRVRASDSEPIPIYAKATARYDGVWTADPAPGTTATVDQQGEYVQRQVVRLQGNTAPNAPSSPAPAHGSTGVGTAPQLQWSASDPDGDALTYTVYLDGVKVASGLQGTTYTPTSLEAGTTHIWRVVATDEYGATTSGPTWQFETDEAEKAPSAAFTTSTDRVSLGGTVSFDASATSDANGNIVAYEWNFDDGATKSGRTVSHAFADEGIYRVTLTVHDATGLVDERTHNVMVVEEGSPFEILSYPMVGYDRGNTGFSPETEGPKGTDGIERIWTVKTQSGFTSPPVVAGDIVYFQSYQGIYAINASTGNVRWHQSRTFNYDSAPAVAGDTVVTSGGTKVAAFDRFTGNMQWESGVGSSATPVVGYDTVFVGSKAIDLDTGTKRWALNLGTIRGRPALDGGRVFITSYENGVFALNPTDGSTVWSFDDGEDWAAAPVATGDRVFAVNWNGAVRAFDQATGTVEWTYQLPTVGGSSQQPEVAPVVTDDRVYVITDYYIYALDRATGDRIWERYPPTQYNNQKRPKVADGVLYLGGGSAVGLPSGYDTLWTYDSIYAGPTVVNDTVFTGTDGNFYALKDRTPDSDDDGIVDTNDGCAFEPEDSDGFSDGDGCPDLNNDGDNWADEVDPAPDTANADGTWRPDGEPGEGKADTDGDGTLNYADPDNDGDGLDDGTDPAPLDANADDDGWDDREDPNPTDPNSDGEWLEDGVGEETKVDADGDGVANFADPDNDGDGLSDVTEAGIGTNGIESDTDGDAVNDGPEVESHGTNPMRADTDGDGYSDGAELTEGTDPLRTVAMSVTGTNVTARSGASVTVPITLTNTGQNASGFLLNASLPDGWTVLNQSSAGGTWNDNATRWVWGTLEPGDSVSPSVTLGVPGDTSGGSYTLDSVARAGDGVQNSTSLTVEVKADGGGAGSSGGGGGGGSVPPPSILKEVTQLSDGGVEMTIQNGLKGRTAQQYFDGVQAGSATFDRLRISFAYSLQEFSFALHPSADVPGGASALGSAESLGYLSIDHEIQNGYFESVELRFEVPKSALPEGTASGDVTLYRADGGSWTKIETSRSGSTYVATASGFGTYAVGVDTTADGTPTANPATTAESTQTEGEQTATPTTTPEDGQPGFGVLVAMLALLSVVAALRHR